MSIPVNEPVHTVGNGNASTKDVGMLQRILELQDELGLSQGQLLAIAREIVGEDVRTIDRLLQDERRVLIAELERLRDEAAVSV